MPVPEIAAISSGVVPVDRARALLAEHRVDASTVFLATSLNWKFDR